MTSTLPELGSGGSGGGGSYLLAVLFEMPGLRLFSDSIVLLLTTGLEL